MAVGFFPLCHRQSLPGETDKRFAADFRIPTSRLGATQPHPTVVAACG
jgi:hypothetical protein